MNSEQRSRHEHEHGHGHPDEDDVDFFEPPGWEERYAGDVDMWSGRPNAQLVAEASRLTPGTALDVGCGEGGDALWLAQHGWQVTASDFADAAL